MAQCAGASPTAAPLLFVRDTKTRNRLLVDTGAQVSVLPRRCLPRGSARLEPAPPGQQLVAANGSPIQVYGTCLLDMALSRKHRFRHRFYVTDVTTPILGTDFLGAHRLVVDVGGQQLLQDGTVCASARRSRLTSVGVRLVREQAAATITQPRPQFDDFAAVAKAQAEDRSLDNLQAADSSLRLRHIPFGDGLLLCDVSTGSPRPVLP